MEQSRAPNDTKSSAKTTRTHRPGGLAATITDGETGFLFAQPSTESFLGGVRRAFSTFMAKDCLDSVRRSAVTRSFTWGLSAACYGTLYRKTVSP